MINKNVPADVANVCFYKGTEAPFSGKYLHNKKKGTYHCAICQSILFSSNEKYDSGSGWPSFWNYKESKNIKTQQDLSHGMVRTEVLCAQCGSHLGHVFEDGPAPTGLRYCINSLALEFME